MHICMYVYLHTHTRSYTHTHTHHHHPNFTTGDGGLLFRDVCCECGGGLFPVGGFPDGMQGLDGVYTSMQV